MTRKRQIHDLVIDEISLVDKGANQHAVVTIAKSASGEKENEMDVYDEQGNQLDPETLDDGDVVYGEDGQAYLFELDADDEVDGELEYEEEGELQEVGKAFPRLGTGNRANQVRAAGMYGKQQGQRVAGAAKRGGRRFEAGAQQGAARLGAGAASTTGFVQANAGKFGIGAGALGGTGVGYGLGTNRNKVGKSASFADEIREELSKALTDADRDEVISKAMAQFDELAEEVSKAQEAAAQEREIRLQAEYTEIAKSYNLPIRDDLLGSTLKECAENLSEESCQVIAKCLEAAGEAVFMEQGLRGGGDNSDVLAQVSAYASERVSKSGMTPEEFQAEVFASNPELYDEYLSEKN